MKNIFIISSYMYFTAKLWNPLIFAQEAFELESLLIRNTLSFLFVIALDENLFLPFLDTMADFHQYWDVLLSCDVEVQVCKSNDFHSISCLKLDSHPFFLMTYPDLG